MLDLLQSFWYLSVRIYFEIYFLIFGKPKFNKNIENTASLYSQNNFSGWFSKIRFVNAPYLQVEKIIPKNGVIVELGCGEGIFSNFLAVSSKRRKVYGYDIDKERIKEANRGLKNTKFQKADVTKLKIPKANAIVMFHLLHHLLSKKLQDELIKKCVKSLNKNGKIIIVEIDNKPFFKYFFTYLIDHLLIAGLFERKIYEPNIFFRNEKEWKELFKKNNLKCKIIYASKGKPFSNIIFELNLQNK